MLSLPICKYALSFICDFLALLFISIPSLLGESSRKQTLNGTRNTSGFYAELHGGEKERK
jgi:hypothetical protein